MISHRSVTQRAQLPLDLAHVLAPGRSDLEQGLDHLDFIPIILPRDFDATGIVQKSRILPHAVGLEWQGFSEGRTV
jgi:hypothetical protein